VAVGAVQFARTDRPSLPASQTSWCRCHGCYQSALAHTREDDHEVDRRKRLDARTLVEIEVIAKLAARTPVCRYVYRTSNHLPSEGFRPQTLLTSLTDPKAYPADEIRALS